SNKRHYDGDREDVQGNQICRLLPKMISILESTGEHTSNTSNKEITEVTRKNNENIKFLKGRGLEYMVQHHSRFNNDLSFYAEKYMKINSISNIFFTQLAVIKEDELFDDSTVIALLKIFLKQAFILHLTHKVSRLTSLNMDNHHTLQQVKELDHLTNDLIISNLTQNNASNQIDMSTMIQRRH
ncbi:5970_t:CDS:2, partial [Funneliformis caledonium]